MSKVVDEKLDPGNISLTKLPNSYDSITKEDQHEDDQSGQVKIKGPYPKIVIFIILNEFCERYRLVFYLLANSKK
jgi:hypothetical protein